MQFPPTAARVLHRRDKYGVREEIPVLDHQLDARAVHMHDAARPDVEMADLAVAHLSIRQADKLAAGMDERVGIFTEQAVVGGLARQGNGIGLGFSTIAPTIEDDENKRFRTSHRIS